MDYRQGSDNNFASLVEQGAFTPDSPRHYIEAGVLEGHASPMVPLSTIGRLLNVY